MDFKDKKVLITGASRGIGFAAAQEFLALGASVAINGRTERSVAAAIEELDAGDRVLGVPGDIGRVEDCESVVAAAIENLGGLDVLVNNAGIISESTIDKTDEAIWDESLNVMLKGTFFCSRAAVPALRAARGAIVNTASVAGLLGFDGIAAYCAAKGGVVNLTRAMAMELAPEVRVNCVCPGYVDTDMVRRDYIDLADDPAEAEREAIEEAPLRRMAAPEEIGKAIVYLASYDARFITGVALPMDGGGSAGI